VDVQRERVDVEGGVVVGQVVEGAVELAGVDVVRHRDVRVVREGRLHVERTGAHRLGQQLALGDALGHRDEHHRRHRPEGAGAPQPHREHPVPAGHQGQVLLDVHQGLQAGRRQQGHVGGDGVGLLVAERGPVVAQLAGERLGHGHRHADGHPVDRVATGGPGRSSRHRRGVRSSRGRRHGADHSPGRWRQRAGTNPTRSYAVASVMAAT
jgi:hypothetical protein